MSVALIATEAYAYAGRSLKSGDLFDASEKDAALLKLVGRAKDAPVVRRSYLGRALAPEVPENTEPPDEAAPVAKRAYRRRDLVSEP